MSANDVVALITSAEQRNQRSRREDASKKKPIPSMVLERLACQ